MVGWGWGAFSQRCTLCCGYPTSLIRLGVVLIHLTSHWNRRKGESEREREKDRREKNHRVKSQRMKNEMARIKERRLKERRIKERRQ